MSYAIVGFGAVGQALARAFAPKNIKVAVASRRPPEALAPQARAIGPTVVAESLRACGLSGFPHTPLGPTSVCGRSNFEKD
jgi:predicted dinucleotide-binding enzyme